MLPLPRAVSVVVVMATASAVTLHSVPVTVVVIVVALLPLLPFVLLLSGCVVNVLGPGACGSLGDGVSR